MAGAADKIFFHQSQVYLQAGDPGLEVRDFLRAYSGKVIEVHS